MTVMLVAWVTSCTFTSQFPVLVPCNQSVMMLLLYDRDLRSEIPVGWYLVLVPGTVPGTPAWYQVPVGTARRKSICVWQYCMNRSS